MVRVVRNRQSLGFVSGPLRGACIVALAATAMAGCSADIARLDNPSYGLADAKPVPPEPIAGRRNAGAPNPMRNEGWPDSGARGGALPPPALPPVESRPLPPPPSTTVAALPQPSSPPVSPSRPFDAPKKEAAAAPAPAARPAAVASGTTIDVAPGDTLYGLSKKHHVSVASLMEVNGLKSATLRPGQKLVLPQGSRRPLERSAIAAASPVPQASAPVAAPKIAPQAAPSVASAPPAVAPAANVAGWTGTHTVKAGESLYGIARQHKVKLTDLQSANAVTDPTKVRPGAVLKVPGDGSAAPATPAAVAAAPEAPRAEANAPAATPPALPEAKSEAVGGPGVKVINATPAPAATVAPPAATKVASVGATPVPSAKAAGATFAWPAKGPLLAEFGKRTDGSANDGINISVPAGADVTAADAGTVAYAGSELKGYGNLVLVRHENGWVTAYAHADQVLVKRGDTVKRGQVIAKAGKTGSVDQPQVHFQLRRGSTPVDPMPHLEKN